MRKEATALSRAKVLRPILEIEEQGFPVIPTAFNIDRYGPIFAFRLM